MGGGVSRRERQRAWSSPPAAGRSSRDRAAQRRPREKSEQCQSVIASLPMTELSSGGHVLRREKTAYSIAVQDQQQRRCCQSERLRCFDGELKISRALKASRNFVQDLSSADANFITFGLCLLFFFNTPGVCVASSCQFSVPPPFSVKTKPLVRIILRQFN